MESHKAVSYTHLDVYKRQIAMMAAVAAMVCENPVEICGAQAVNKSYPGFFEDYQSLGGKVVMEQI